MRILFVWPNKDQFGFKPVGISLLSALCKRCGHETMLFDTSFINFGYRNNTQAGEEVLIFKPVDFSPYDIEKKDTPLKETFFAVLKSFCPDLIGFSALSDEYPIAYKLAKYAKEYDKNIINIFGNKYATICPEQVISEQCVDFVCVGEGLEAFPELVNNLSEGEDVTNIKNIWTKRDGKIIRNPVRPYLKNLDDLPFVDWDIFDSRQFLKPFDGNIYRGGDWMSNWGCPYKCSYCINEFLLGIYGKKGFMRAYSAERAIAELKYLQDEYKLEFLKFHDEDFLMRPFNKFEHFANLYAKEVKLPFVIETNPHSVSEEKIKLLKKMGCVSVSMGVETGNEQIRRDILKRRDTTQDVINAFRLFKKYDIRTSSFNMIALPYETREAIFDTIELNRKADAMVPNAGFFFPFEGTKLRELSIKEGFYNPDAFSIYKRDEPALNLPSLSKEELYSLRKNFVLYVKLPKVFYPFINRAERNDETGKTIFSILAQIYKKYVLENGGFFSMDIHNSESRDTKNGPLNKEFFIKDYKRHKIGVDKK